MNQLKADFFRNIGYGAISKIAQMIFGFVIIGFVIRSVGIAQWGVLTISVSLISLLSVLQSSISGAAGKKLTDFFISKDIEGYTKYYKATIYITVLIILVIICVLSICYCFFLENLIEESISLLKIIYVLTSVNVVIQILGLPGIALLQSINRLDYHSKILFFGFIIRAILVLILFKFFKTIVVYSIILLAEVIFNTIFLYIITFKITGINLIPKTEKIGKEYLLNVVKFNSLNLVNNLNYIVFLQVPSIIVAKKFGLEYSGYYGIGLQLNNLLRGLVSIVGMAIMPVFNIINAKKDYNKLVQVFLIFTKIFSVLGLFVIILSFYFIEQGIYLWLKIENQNLIYFLKVFSFFIAIGISFIPSANILVTLEKLKFSSFFGLFLSILSSLIIYVFPFKSNPYVWVPIIMSIIFFLYNYQRFFLAIKFLSIEFNQYKSLLYMIFVFSGFNFLIVNFCYTESLLIRSAGLIISMGIVFLFIGNKNINDLRLLLKR